MHRAAGADPGHAGAAEPVAGSAAAEGELAADAPPPTGASSEPAAASRRVPVTLLTGFLGAGKTARLNATLAAGASRVAVIENELGALGVDGALVANTHDDGVVELANGCLCCSAEVDLVAALEGLAHRRASRPFDRVVIETTGLADVGPVVSLLSDQDDPLSEDFEFDGTVTVVDAAGFRAWAGAGGGASAGPLVARASGFGGPALGDVRGGAAGGAAGAAEAALADSLADAFDDGPGRRAARMSFWRQVALADQIIVSKADLAGEDGVRQVLEAIAMVNPLVREPIVDLAGVAQPLPPPLSATEGPFRALRRPPGRKFGGGVLTLSTKKRQRTAAPHLESVQALSLPLRPDAPLRAQALRRLVEGLLSPGAGGPDVAEAVGPGAEAWRVKGFVTIENDGPTLIQGVGDHVTLEPWGGALQDFRPFLVVIGEGLQLERLEGAVAACASGRVLPMLR